MSILTVVLYVVGAVAFFTAGLLVGRHNPKVAAEAAAVVQAAQKKV